MTSDEDNRVPDSQADPADPQTSAEGLAVPDPSQPDPDPSQPGPSRADTSQPDPNRPDPSQPDTPHDESAPAGASPAPDDVAPGRPVGKVRETGTCFLLMVVTLGFYSLYWYYQTHEEMQRHSGQGIGGVIGLVLAIFLGFVSPFLSAHEVGRLYERRGQDAPVSAVTGLWFLLLAWFFFVGAIVWFVKVNGALNEYWRSLGAE